MNIQSDKERLSQSRNLKHLLSPIQMHEMVTVCSYPNDFTHEQCYHEISSALVPSHQTATALANPLWVFTPRADDDEKSLVLTRDFNGVRPSYLEIREDFRLFHKLYHDYKTDRFIKIDDSGNEECVAIIDQESERVLIRKKEIREYLGRKNMHLAIKFRYIERSQENLEELNLTEDCLPDKQNGVSCWRLVYKDYASPRPGGIRSISNLTGFSLIEPLSQPNNWAQVVTQEEKFADFAIRMDENGEPIEHTCNPSKLAGYFGKNPDAPNFLTKVDFRKEVLDKYYQHPGKYRVSGGIVRCGGLWLIDIDTHHDDKVCAWLGNLGEQLPYQEQLHWKSYNFVSGTGVSDTFFRQQLLAEIVESDRPEHTFPLRYNELAQVCQKHLDWSLLLPLAKEDEHHLHNIRIPATDEQRDFDELVLNLTKILIDSLNEKQLNKLIPQVQREFLTGSISRLEAALIACRVNNADKHIKFLRNLQSLRSSGSSHRKGSEYSKIAKQFGIDDKDLRTVFAGILVQAVQFLEYLINLVKNSKFPSPSPTPQHQQSQS